MRKSKQSVKYGLMAFIIGIIFSSCTDVKKVAYFKDVPDSTKEKMVRDAPYTDPIIIPDDILSVTITLIDPTTAAPVNQASVAPVSAASTSSAVAPGLVPGLLVDREGNISFPIMGTIKVAGLTSYEAKERIKTEAKKYFKDPDVQVRFANYKVTVIGEVAHPATFVVPNEKVSVLDAIGMAGDLTIYGRRENVMVIRENNGKKELYRLNLNSSDIFKSPYFYLKQNDVVYVEPNKSKAVQADAEQTRFIEIAASVATGILLILRLR